MTDIDIVNASTVLQDADIQKAVAALQTQVTRDWLPRWGNDATLHFVPTGGSPDPTHWWIAVLDNSDVAGALGYHDITTSGLPLGKVFAATTQQYNVSWTVDLSHELLEMLADPDVNLTAQITDQNNPNFGAFLAYEVCDPCEDDLLGYLIDDVLVSDFVLPAYFEFFRTDAGPFDFQNKVTGPGQILPGGYLGIYDESLGGWTQVFGKKPGAREFASKMKRIGSRRERRGRSRKAWFASTV